MPNICKCGKIDERTLKQLKTAVDKDMCVECRELARSRRRHKKSSEEFITKALQIHGNTYNYAQVEYKGSTTAVEILCNTHGVFRQAPMNHLRGKGCKKCATAKLRKTPEEFAEEFNRLHPTITLLESYTGALDRIAVSCICGHLWKPVASELLRGSSCPVCSIAGYKTNKPGKLYYLKIRNEDTFVYKIGITNLSVHKRLNVHDREKVVAKVVWEFIDGQEAYDREQCILQIYKEFKYSGPPILKSGNTELFTKDVGNYFTKDNHNDTTNNNSDNSSAP